MDIFTPFRFFSGYIKGYFNSLTIYEREHAGKENYLFLDITEVHIRDNGTGVPRVTNGIRQNLDKFNLPYKIVEVYAKPHNQGFFDAKTNRPIKISKGDFYFSLDFSKFMMPQNKVHIRKMQKLGIPCWFFLHDLIPIYYPQYCLKKDILSFKKWMNIVKRFDGFIANSRATEDEMKKWLKEQSKKSYNNDMKSGYIHLASTFINKEISKNVCKNKKDRIQFLAVSTVEPRKRYDLLVQAFDILWKEDFDVALHIVGKPGWNNQATFNLIRNCVEYGNRLVWHEKYISDEELRMLYSDSDALVFASDTEGFGIPLVEAAAYGKPLIARDIPIFREVTNNEATFFKGESPKELADTIKKWLELYKQNMIFAPKIKLYTWEESASEVVKILSENGLKLK